MLKRDDLWYVSLPDSRSDAEGNRRYSRAVRLSEMRDWIEHLKTIPQAQWRYNDAEKLAYREHCITNWQQYLDGTLTLLDGKKMK